MAKPQIHGIVGDRPGDEVGQDDPFCELLREQHSDTGYRSAQHLANTDLFRSLLRRESCQSKQPEAGDEYRHTRECDEDLSQPLLRAVQLVKGIIQEIILEGMRRFDGFPFPFDRRKRSEGSAG